LYIGHLYYNSSMNLTNIDELKKQISGTVILPADEAYESVRNTFMTKGSPAVVVQPKTNEDLATAIKYARDNALVLSVRSGGHSGAGHSTNDGGLVIDLSLIKTVEVLDAQKRLVRLGSGAHWGDVAEQLGEHGLALSSGDTRTVGVGGLTLGGGVGWMVRQYGLAIDSLVAAEIVLADGRVLHLSETENPNLFWAIRGGSGNFGVVTHFEFIAHPVDTVYAGVVTYKRGDPASTAKTLKAWRDYMRTAPEELNSMFLLMPEFFGNPPSLVGLYCYNGDQQTGEKIIEPLLHIGEVDNNGMAQKPYAQVLEDAHAPGDMRVITNDAFVKDFNDDCIEALAKHEGMIAQIRSIGGAMNRVPADTTAFAHRDSEVLIVAPTFTTADASDEEIEKALAPWRSIQPFAHGAYVNFFSDPDSETQAAVWPSETLARLAKVKHEYDPENIFSQTYSVTSTD
jgi:FAD/FMN-containing dehydrogenase